MGLSTRYTREGELVYGDLVTGAITNTTYDLVLPAGLWAVSLFINANAVSAGTISASYLLPDGTAGEADATEDLAFIGGNAATADWSLIDFIGGVGVYQTVGGTPVTLSGNAGVVLWGGIRFTVAAIGGASATNRIWAVAVRVQ